MKADKTVHNNSDSSVLRDKEVRPPAPEDALNLSREELKGRLNEPHFSDAIGKIGDFITLVRIPELNPITYFAA